MRATVLDEAELTGLPARVQALARNLALTSISAARGYIAGQRHQDNAAGPRAQPKGERGSIGSDKTSPDAARPVARPGQLLAKTIKVTIVLDPAAVGALAMAENGSRPRINIAVAGRTLSASSTRKPCARRSPRFASTGPRLLPSCCRASSPPATSSRRARSSPRSKGRSRSHDPELTTRAAAAASRAGRPCRARPGCRELHLLKA
jgi:hypothetical protein